MISLKVLGSFTFQKVLCAVTPVSRFAGIKTSLCIRRTDLVKFKQDIHSYGTFQGTENESYPMTKSEVCLFSENVLGIPQPHALFEKDPLRCLNKIAERMKKMVPFTTLPLFNGSLEEINDEYCKNQILRGNGGGCAFINPFTKALLEIIGYKTESIIGSPHGSTETMHTSTLVCDLDYRGSYHLVDPATMLPLLQAIPLNFYTESPIYQAYGFKYKFFKCDGNLLWCREPLPQERNVLVDNFKFIKDSTGKTWRVFTTYWLKKEMAIYHFNKFWSNLLRGETSVPARVGGFMYSTFKDGNFVLVTANEGNILAEIIQEDSTGEKFEMEAHELQNFFDKNFPGYPATTLKTVIKADFTWVPRHNSDR